VTWYEEHLLPPLLNMACSAKPNRRQREKIVPRASGDVLEIGFGGGLNLPHYDRDRVRKLFALEPSAAMRASAAERIERAGMDIELIDLPGERIPLADNSIDTVLITYTLCTIEDTATALAGVRRVLRPGGTLLYCEHGRAPDAAVARWQDRLNRPWKRIAGGCNMNRDIPALITAGGFRIDDDQRMYIPGLRVLCYNYWGSAQPR